MKVIKRTATGTVTMGELLAAKGMTATVPAFTPALPSAAVPTVAVRDILTGKHAAMETASVPKVAATVEVFIPTQNRVDPLCSVPLPAITDGSVKLSGELGGKIEKILASSELTDKQRFDKVYKIGVKAREAGRGEVEVYNLWVQVRQIQRGLRDSAEMNFREFVDMDPMEHWSAQFIAGFNSRAGTKGGGGLKPYRLTVQIPGESEPHVSDFDNFGKAEHAAMRWWVLKSETTEHAGMTVVIDTVDVEATIAHVAGGGKGRVYRDSLRFNMTKDLAASMYEKQRRRADAGPSMQSKPKNAGKLSYGMKCKEYRATFSGG